MNSNSAAFQKLRKLEINETEDSPEQQEFLEDLQEIIFSLHSTLFSAKFITSSLTPSSSSITESLNYLRYLVSSLSKGISYLSPPIPCNPEPPNTFSVLKKMMRSPPDGVYLKQSECQEICSLLIGDIRDVEYNCLKEKLMNCQQKIVKYSKIIHESRVRIEEREKELEDLYDHIDLLNDEIKNSVRGSRMRIKTSCSTCTSINQIVWADNIND